MFWLLTFPYPKAGNLSLLWWEYLSTAWQQSWIRIFHFTPMTRFWFFEIVILSDTKCNTWGYKTWNEGICLFLRIFVNTLCCTLLVCLLLYCTVELFSSLCTLVLSKIAESHIVYIVHKIISSLYYQQCFTYKPINKSFVGQLGGPQDHI